MPPKVNQRRNIRVFCSSPARAEGPRGPVRGVCRNLSQGGMFFMGPTLPVGQSFEFSVDLPQGKITALGEIRYQHSYPEGTGMGIRFTRLSQEDLAKITRYVEANAANEVPFR